MSVVIKADSYTKRIQVYPTMYTMDAMQMINLTILIVLEM